MAPVINGPILYMMRVLLPDPLLSVPLAKGALSALKEHQQEGLHFCSLQHFSRQSGRRGWREGRTEARRGRNRMGEAGEGQIRPRDGISSAGAANILTSSQTQFYGTNLHRPVPAMSHSAPHFMQPYPWVLPLHSPYHQRMQLLSFWHSCLDWEGGTNMIGL